MKTGVSTPAHAVKKANKRNDNPVVVKRSFFRVVMCPLLTNMYKTDTYCEGKSKKSVVRQAIKNITNESKAEKRGRGREKKFRKDERRKRL